MECAEAALLVRTPQINNQQRFRRAVPGTGAWPPTRPSVRPAAHRPAPGPDGSRRWPARLRRAGASLARRHGAPACSGVLIKPFIVLHSRNELRRSAERDGGEGEEEARQEKGRGREGEGMQDLPPSTFFLAFSLALKECLIWSVGTREADSFCPPSADYFPSTFTPLKFFSQHLLPTCIAVILLLVQPFLNECHADTGGCRVSSF